MKMLRLTCATALILLVHATGASALDPEAAAKALRPLLPLLLALGIERGVDDDVVRIF